jgi:hypothetical protein
MTPIFTAVLGISLALFYWGRRIALSTVQNGKNFAEKATVYKIAIAAGLALFLVGWPVIKTQEKVMTISSWVYECGIIKFAQVVDNLVLLPIHDLWVWLFSRWNDIILYLRGCVVQAIEDIEAIVDIASLTGIADVITSITDILWCVLEIFDRVSSIEIPYFNDVFVQFGHLVSCIGQEFVKVAISIIKVTIFSEDCDFCDLAPTLPDTCSLLTIAGDGVTIDCSPQNCHSTACTIIECIIEYIKWLLSNIPTLDLNLWLDDLNETICCFSKLWKRPFFVVVGLIDNAVNDNGCMELGDVVDQFVDWATDLIECFDQLINTLTGGAITHFFDFIFQWIFNAAYVVIDGVKAIINCFTSSDQTNCLAAYPDSCVMDVNTGIASEGLQTCNELLEVCFADIPFLDPIFDIGGSFNLTSIGTGILAIVDTVVCPVYLTIECFLGLPDCIDNNGGNVIAAGITCTIQSLGCVQDNVPPFYYFARVLSGGLDFIDTLVSDLQIILQHVSDLVFQVIDGFKCLVDECVGEGFIPPFTGGDGECSIAEAIDCMTHCFSNAESCNADFTGKRFAFPRQSSANYSTEYARQTWRQHLNSSGVSNSTTCGKMLYEKMPNEITLEDDGWGNYYSYTSCLFMFGFGMGSKESYGSDIDVNSFMDSKNMSRVMRLTVSKIKLFNSPHEADTTNTYPTTRKRDDGLKSGIYKMINKPRRIPYNKDSLARKEFLKNNTKWLMTELFNRFTDNKYYRYVVDLNHSVNNITTKYGISKQRRGISPMMLPYQDTKVISLSPKRDETTGRLSTIISDNNLSNLNIEILEAYLEFSNKFMRSYRQDMMERKIRTTLSSRFYKKKHQFDTDNTNKKRSDDFVSYTPYDNINSPSIHFDYHFSRKMMERYYHKDLTLIEMVEKNIVAHKEARRINDLRKSLRIEERLKLAYTIYEVLDRRYVFDYWPTFQKLHMISGFVTPLERDHSVYNVDNLEKWLNGEYGYIPKQGFIDKSEYDGQMDIAKRSKRGSMVDLAMGTFNAREHLKLGPFLITFNETNIFPEIDGLLDLLTNVGSSNSIEGNIHTIADDFDFNIVMVQTVDYFISLFRGPANLLYDMYKGVQNTTHNFDYKEFFLNDTGSFITETLTCTVPENIDGTYLYNPFCLPLLPEGFLEFLQPIPTGAFPMQIPWPQELIVDNCTNIYNGKPRPFYNFNISNNCIEPDGEVNRPFCPICDFCYANYTTCKDATDKFVDGLDTVLYVISSLPRTGDSYLRDGFPVKDMFYVTLFVVIVVGIMTSPWNLLGAIPALFLLFWMISLRNNTVTFGAIVILAIIVVAIMIPSAIASFPMTFTVLGILSVFWVLSIFSPFVIADNIDLIGMLRSTVVFVNENFIFTKLPGILFYLILGFMIYYAIFSTVESSRAWKIGVLFVMGTTFSALFFTEMGPQVRLPRLDPLVTRIDKFVYPKDTAIPYVDKFCVVWTFGNFGLLLALAPIFFGFIFPFIFDVFLSTSVLAGDTFMILIGYGSNQTLFRLSQFRQDTGRILQRVQRGLRSINGLRLPRRRD